MNIDTISEIIWVWKNLMRNVEEFLTDLNIDVFETYLGTLEITGVFFV